MPQMILLGKLSVHLINSPLFYLHLVTQRQVSLNIRLHYVQYTSYKHFNPLPSPRPPKWKCLSRLIMCSYVTYNYIDHTVS